MLVQSFTSYVSTFLSYLFLLDRASLSRPGRPAAQAGTELGISLPQLPDEFGQQACLYTGPGLSAKAS